jgi:ribose 5-phosphate isomerase A
MDLKKEAARVACSYIENNISVGLGDGSTVRLLAGLLIDKIKDGLNVRLYTSSLTTQVFLEAAGLQVSDISQTGSLELYFDGCDEVDHQLNALKSGSGIHTMEKLLASMAEKFIIMADAPKYVEKFDSKYPLVLEILPQAISFVQKEIHDLYPDASLSIRKSPEHAGKPTLTRNGNLLVDCLFPYWPEAGRIQHESKNITGVVEISLFYQLISEALIAGNDGVLKYERK